MKYKFEIVDNDTTKLTYKDKEFKIKRNINLLKRTQEVYFKARTKMMVDLTKQGITKKDLIIEKKENGKTYYDDTNIREIENNYIEMENLEIYNSIAEDYTGMSWIELIEDIGLEESDVEEFAFNFAKSLQGKDKTPSEEKK